jgi:hypothetical protein
MVWPDHRDVHDRNRDRLLLTIVKAADPNDDKS